MLNDLLATKLYIPPARKHHVPRMRLAQILNEVWQPGRELTLVSAPAGYGKTTLVTEWMQSLQIRTAWLSLDQADNDPARFLAYLIAALGQINQQWSEWFGGLTINHPDADETVLTGLVPDQATLYGIISRLQDLGLELSSVNSQKIKEIRDAGE